MSPFRLFLPLTQDSASSVKVIKIVPIFMHLFVNKDIAIYLFKMMCLFLDTFFNRHIALYINHIPILLGAVDAERKQQKRFFPRVYKNFRETP